MTMQTAYRALAGLALAAAVLLGEACGGAPSTLKATWRDPTAQKVKFNKIMAIAINGDETMRRSMETAMAQKIPGTVPSYTVIPQADLRDKEKVRAYVHASGCDGAILMRIVGVEKETTYVPGSAYPYGNMYGYYGWGAGYAYDPGYLRTDKLVSVETNVYQVADEKLIWASRSETTSPESVDDLIDSVVRVNAEKMKAEKLI